MSVCANLVKEFLDSKNLNYLSRLDSSGNTIISIDYEKYTTHLHFKGDEGEYLSLRIYYENIPEEKISDIIFLCNTFHKEYKWICVYVDDDNDLVIQHDAILCPENAADATMELFLRIAKIISSIKPRIMKTLYS